MTSSGRWLRRATLTAVVTLAVLVTCVVPARAWEASTPLIVAQDEDRFWNYDCQFGSTGTFSGYDWPVTIVFWGNATVDKVKAALRSSLPIWGVDEHLRVCDTVHRRRWVWDADQGIKTLSLTKALHMRVYAGRMGRLTNATWGSYVLATTHYDINELSANPVFGRSEEAAAAIEALCVSVYGADAVVADALPLFNAEPDRLEQHANDSGGVDGHYWQCDGLATMVYVP